MDEITTQSYEPTKWIDDVKILNMKRFRDDGGSFLELVRFSDDGIVMEDENNELSANGIPFRVKQINHSYVYPGAVKAWHLHYAQEDCWYVPPDDRLIIGLYDLRKNSPTYTRSMRFVLGDGQGQLLLIPRGVAHGCANRYDRKMQLMYLVNQNFDAKNPDEHRLSWDSLMGADFWSIQMG